MAIFVAYWRRRYEHLVCTLSCKNLLFSGALRLDKLFFSPGRTLAGSSAHGCMAAGVGGAVGVALARLTGHRSNGGATKTGLSDKRQHSGGVALCCLPHCMVQ